MGLAKKNQFKHLSFAEPDSIFTIYKFFQLMLQPTYWLKRSVLEKFECTKNLSWLASSRKSCLRFCPTRSVLLNLKFWCIFVYGIFAVQNFSLSLQLVQSAGFRIKLFVNFLLITLGWKTAFSRSTQFFNFQNTMFENLDACTFLEKPFVLILIPVNSLNK